MTCRAASARIHPMITPADFGKDHWSLLAYVETCCVNGNGGIGTLDGRRMRCHTERHPLLCEGNLNWKPSYGTRLSRYWPNGTTPDPTRLLEHHDDYDCLDDLVHAGLVTIHSLVNRLVTMTPVGLHVSAALRAHKANGHPFATFQWTPDSM